MKKHLAIFKNNGAENILSGKKIIESRFSKAKIAPFGQVFKGDLVYIKPSGKEIVGQFRVKKVISYDGLTEDDFLEIRQRFGKGLAVEDGDYWQAKAGSRYGTLIFIGQVEKFLTSPIKLDKKDLRGWLVIN